jgi:hypothetical protein
MLKYHGRLVDKSDKSVCNFFSEQFECTKVLADDEPDDPSSGRRTLWALLTFSNSDSIQHMERNETNKVGHNVMFLCYY